MRKIDELRRLMMEHNVTAYMVASDDFHNSEYVGEYFKVREFLSGFTGSAGTLVVTGDKAGLWTDGRYFIQAEQQLRGTGIDLYKAGTENVLTIKDFLLQNLKKGDTVGFDGRTFDYHKGNEIREYLNKSGIEIKYNIDLGGEVWTDRPEISANEIYDLPVKYSGKSREEKLKAVRERMKENEAGCHILSSLDDICWLLNIRGNDVRCNPVVLSYMIITEDKAYVYLAKDRLSDELNKEFEKLNIYTKSYMSIYEDINALENMMPGGLKVMFDDMKVNFTLGSAIMNYGEEKVVIAENPTSIMKAVKNETEIDNMRKAHIKDGVAVTRFIYYVKKHFGKLKMNEYELGKKIQEFRSEQENYRGESFEPIVATGSNGAMCHYEADEKNSSEIKKDTFLLFDTGGQYLEGTTDITRTVALGEISDEMKKHYTAVLKGNLRLGSIKFPYGVRGINLDILAREELWGMGLDYNHGTGHGIGYFLNVHEGPNSIRFRGNDSTVFDEGMITSNEPGYYREGYYGIRLENLILCKKAEKTEYGQFMEFETLTKVPFDINAIDLSMLTEREKTILNLYHKNVYEEISPYLDTEERAWLKEATRQIW